MAALAAAYAAAVSVLFVVQYPDLVTAFALVPAAIIAAPLALGRLTAFRIACLAVAVVLLPFGLILAMAGMFLYWPAAIPLALAATPLPNRYPRGP